MNKENCTLKLVDEIILYYDARSMKRQIAEYIVASSTLALITLKRHTVTLYLYGISSFTPVASIRLC